jgi:hypothetical protein
MDYFDDWRLAAIYLVNSNRKKIPSVRQHKIDSISKPLTG